MQDLHPDWAQRLMNTPQYSRPKKALLRGITRLLLPSVRDGKIIEVYSPTVQEAVGEKSPGRDSVQVDSVRETVMSREEVRPMNAVTMWVLPLVFTVGRQT